MSLLMDALKKAEQEKKEAAKRLKEARENSGENYKLESNDPEDREAAATDPGAESGSDDTDEASALELEEEPEAQQESPGSDDSSVVEEEKEVASSTEELTEPTLAGSQELSLEPIPDDTLENPEISDDDEDFDEDIKPDRGDKTFAAPPLSLEEEHPAPFDATSRDQIIENTRSETISDSRVSRSFISAEALVQDMGSGNEVPTPVAAQTVFSAVARSSERRQFLDWMVFLGLVTVIIMAIGTFYYLKVTPLTPETSSPLVARGVEAGSDQPLDINLPEKTTDTTARGEIPTPEPLAATTEVTVVEEGETQSTASAEDPVPEEPGTITGKEIKESVSTSEEELATTGKLEVEAVREDTVQREPAKTAVTDASEAVIPKSLPEHIAVDHSAIAISRSRSASSQDQLIASAFAAYQRGDYASSEADYRQVLKSRPGDRDALLGMAALAYRKGNTQSAFEHYLQVLKHHPKDTAARAAIINLQGATDPVRSESLLKLMIDDNPEADYLYFILGNVYAGNDRWGDAQQAFFEAHRLRSQNPDYAYNLAVSLDHLGKYKTAVDYYTTALELSDTQQTGFDANAATRRLGKLTAGQNQR